MNEYAIWKDRPVTVVGPLVAKVRNQKGEVIGEGPFLGYEVQLPFGHRQYAQPDQITTITKAEYEKAVKEERSEKERLSKREGFSAPEVVYKGSGFTNAQSERGR